MSDDKNSTEKNSRFKRYEARQKAQQEKEKPETRKVIGWNMVTNEKIYE